VALASQTLTRLTHAGIATHELTRSRIYPISKTLIFRVHSPHWLTRALFLGEHQTATGEISDTLRGLAGDHRHELGVYSGSFRFHDGRIRRTPLGTTVPRLRYVKTIFWRSWDCCLADRARAYPPHRSTSCVGKILPGPPSCIDELEALGRFEARKALPKLMATVLAEHAPRFKPMEKMAPVGLKYDTAGS